PTGLYYYGARYYDPTIGRFATRDPSSLNTKKPETLNPYIIADDNPESFKDPNGLSTVPGSAYDIMRSAVADVFYGWIVAFVAFVWDPWDAPVMTAVLGGLVAGLQTSYGNYWIAAVGVAAVVVWLDQLKDQSPWWIAWVPDYIAKGISYAAALALGIGSSTIDNLAARVGYPGL